MPRSQERPLVGLPLHGAEQGRSGTGPDGSRLPLPSLGPSCSGFQPQHHHPVWVTPPFGDFSLEGWVGWGRLGKSQMVLKTAQTDRWAAPAGVLRDWNATPFFLLRNWFLTYTSGVTLVFKKVSIWDAKNHVGTSESCVTQLWARDHSRARYSGRLASEKPIHRRCLLLLNQPPPGQTQGVPGPPGQEGEGRLSEDYAAGQQEQTFSASDNCLRFSCFTSVFHFRFHPFKTLGFPSLDLQNSLEHGSPSLCFSSYFLVL